MRWNWALRHAYWTPQIPEGDADKPWRDQTDNYYWRAWRVQKMLEWLRDKATCSHLMCMLAQLRDTRHTLVQMKDKLRDEGKLDMPTSPASPRQCKPYVDTPLREKGSRWYASMYFLHKDIWEALTALPADKALELINSVGDTELANAFQQWTNGQTWSAKDKPWEFYPVTRKMRFEKGIKLLQKLYDPAEWMVKPAVDLERMRRYARALMPAQATPAQVSPAVLRTARMLRQGALQQRQQHEEARGTNIWLPIGLGVLLLGGGAALYWYMTKDEQEPVPNLPSWDDDEYDEA
jgi:hypothetical protein